MAKIHGMLTLDELAALVELGEIETVAVLFTDHYGRLMGKRFDAEFFITDGANHGTHSCDYLLTVDMDMEPVPGYKFANWELGYGDFHLVPDLNTLRRASWLDKTALVLCDLEDEKTHRAHLCRSARHVAASIGTRGNYGVQRQSGFRVGVLHF